jgi:hypothetical protein
MQAYMKSALPYLGVPVPTVRSITRSAERQRPPDSTAGLVATLPMFEEMIVTGAWWDHVDEISHRIGALLGSTRTR